MPAETLTVCIIRGGYDPLGNTRWETPDSFSLQPQTDPINQRQQTQADDSGTVSQRSSGASELQHFRPKPKALISKKQEEGKSEERGKDSV